MIIAFQGGSKAEIDFSGLMRRRLTVTGSTLRPQSDLSKAAIADDLRRHVWPMVEAGKLRPVMDEELALTDAAAARAHVARTGAPIVVKADGLAAGKGVVVTDDLDAALQRLETTLALVEGWVDVVTDAAVAQHLPNAAALAEVVRRRRASAGPAEKVFSSLVGLELRPRRLREAAALWTQLTDATDAATRDGVWSHPDHVPSATDLDDPSTFIARASGEETPETGRDEMDDALDALLAQGLA